MAKTRPGIVRFNEKWKRSTTHSHKGVACWQWTAGFSATGYGMFYFFDPKYEKTKNGQAHRFSYIHHVGLIPDGLDIDHLCSNTVCVNPAHLEAVTRLENHHRGNAGAHEAAKTHCKRGHEFSEENTYRAPGRRNRTCRICRKQAELERRARRKAGVPVWNRGVECKVGHPMTEENTYSYTRFNGVVTRDCRKCLQRREKGNKRRKKERWLKRKAQLS